MSLRDELRARVAEHRKQSEERAYNKRLDEPFGRTMIADRDVAQCGSGPSQPPIRERLLSERIRFTHQLLAVEEALEALDANPDFEKHDATRAKLRAAGYHDC